MCKVQRPPKRQTPSFLSCSWFQVWLKPLLTPDPPEPGEGPLPAPQVLGTSGAVPRPGRAVSLSRGRCHLALLRPWTQHGPACGAGAALSCKLDDKRTTEAHDQALLHPLPSGPPVNATTQQEQPKGGATHSWLGTASWSSRALQRPGGDRPPLCRLASAKERSHHPPCLQQPPPSCWPRPPRTNDPGSHSPSPNGSSPTEGDAQAQKGCDANARAPGRAP